MVNKLIETTEEPCPPQLANLKEKQVRFTSCCEKAEMIDMVYKMLEIE